MNLNSYERTLADLVEHLQYSNQKAALLIGAGCSVTAGIPAGSGFVKLIRDQFPSAYRRAGKPNYPNCMKALIPIQRKELIAKKIEEAKINWCHVAIAQLIATGHTDRVLTTNFDPLVVRACALIQQFPAVYDYAASPAFKPGSVTDPSIFHLHGQGTGFKLLNTEEEMEDIRKYLPGLLENTVQERTLIVVGYSGGDPVFEVLSEVGEFPQGVYWVTYDHEDPADHVQHDLIGRCTNAMFIRSRDADSFFQRLATGLDCFPPDYVKKPFTHFAETLEVLTEFQPAHDPNRDDENASSEMHSRETARSAGAVDIMQSVRENLSKAIDTFEQGNSDLVQAAWALYSQEKYEQVVDLFEAADVSDEHAAYYAWGNALFELALLNDDHDDAVVLFHDACDKYRKAAEIKPKDHEVVNNWGLTLTQLALGTSGDNAVDLLHDACDKYQSALDVKPKDHSALYNWGNALVELANLASSDDAVEHLKTACSKYRHALRAKPNKHEALHNWGNALFERTQFASSEDAIALFHDACDKFQRAIKIKPDKHEAFHSWGVVLNAWADHIADDNPKEAAQLRTEAEAKFDEIRRSIAKVMHRIVKASG